MKQTLSITLLYLFFGQAFSQSTENEQKIKTALEDYFHFERENIHVQFNKTIYINNENIGFKGYVFNKQSSIPNLNTTNIQLVIYDAQGQVIQKQLLHASLGTFEGIVALNEKFSSGLYRFHFYTNWMNNFTEDESFHQTIEVVNKNEPYNLKSNQPDLNNISITICPESGQFIKDINNTVGIKIKDCNQIGIQITEGIIVDSKGRTIVSFFTNKMGYGKFNFIPASKEIYSAKIVTDKLNLQKQLPQTHNTGIAITYNNNLPNNILEVSIKTNSAGVNLYQNKNYILVIHQNGKHIQKSFNFNDKIPVQILNFDKNDLSNGVNSIRVIDENGNEIAERLLYLTKATKATPLLEAQFTGNDSIVLYGKLDVKLANLSISILPAENAFNDHKNSIVGSFCLNAYLEKPVLDNYIYFDRQNKTRAYDMELLMLNQERGKYPWNNIMTIKPKELFKFTKGVSINGTIVKTLNPKTKYKVALISLENNVFEEAIVDKNNKFSFDNFCATDSTAYQLELMNESNKPIESKMIANVLFTNENFQKKLNFEAKDCMPVKDFKNTFTFNKPESDKKIIALSEVNIKNNYKKPIYNHQNESTNRLAKAYKIGETDFGSVLDFIGKNGYAIRTDDDFMVYITDMRNLNSVNGSTVSPSVFIDDIQILGFDVLYGINLINVDEIFIDKTGTSNSSFGGLGTIKIYLKDGASRSFFTKKYTTLIVKSGFEKTKEYKNINYIRSKEFDVFGTMQWSPNVFLDADQIFEVKFLNANQKEIQVLIEGFTTDGQFISEMKKLSVAPKL